MKKMKRIFNRWPVLLSVVFLVPGGCGDPATGEIDPRNAAATANASIATGAGQYAWKWKEGDRVSMYTTGASANSNVPFTLSGVAASGTSGKLSGTIRQTATGTHIFTAAYPYSESAAADQSKYVVGVPAGQNITTGGPDPSTCVLVGTPIAKSLPASGSVQLGAMEFSSPLAVTKLSFTTNRTFTAGEKVTGIRFSAEEQNIAGQAYCNLTDPTGELDVFSSGSSVIDLAYPEGSEPAIANAFDAWFTSFPFTVAAGKSYSITIYTDIQAFTGKITAGQDIRFGAGVVTTLSVDINSNFKTDVPLLGKKWLELPDKIFGAGLRGKAYHAVMKDGREARNYSILYDEAEKLSLWVAFPMNRNLHLGSGRDEKWQYDTEGDIPTSAQPNVISNTYGTYSADNMDRGHQIANADRNGSTPACDQTYMMTNMTPQYKWLNQGKWEGLESAIRVVANASTTPDQDTLYVVTGPLLNADNPKYINDNSGKACRVPDGYFKIILWSKYDSPSSRRYNSVGFIWPVNYAADAKNKDQFTEFQTSVGAVEDETGFSFFDNLGLDAATMSAIKSTSTWSSFTNRNNNPY